MSLDHHHHHYQAHMPMRLPNGLARVAASMSRSNSPQNHYNTISSVKLIEEETQPKYHPDHFYPAKLREVLNDRYQIIAKLGYGVTATVWLAQDLHA
jgi:hypothetical protein